MGLTMAAPKIAEVTGLGQSIVHRILAEAKEADQG
jgi:hypothetical protein